MISREFDQIWTGFSPDFNRTLTGIHGIWLNQVKNCSNPLLGRPHLPGADTRLLLLSWCSLEGCPFGRFQCTTSTAACHSVLQLVLFLFCYDNFLLRLCCSVWSFAYLGRAKGDAPKVTEPNLRFPAVFCENLRFSAKICGFLRFPAPSTCLNLQEKGWICENLRFSAKICVLGFLCHLSSVPLSRPWLTVCCEEVTL